MHDIAQKRTGQNAHYLLWVGICHARLNQLVESREALEQAIQAYSVVPSWPPLRYYVGLCEKLFVAIQNATHQQLLAEWFAQSVQNLKLEKFLK
jgi:hypothetical protein